MDRSELPVIVEEIDINELTGYPNHPFKLYKEDKLNELIESIKDNGLMHPIIVRKNDNTGYTVLAGHNRVEAYKALSRDKINAIVKQGITDEEADLIVVESNLQQRDKFLPSEKGKAFRMKVEAIARQGERTDLTVRESGKINDTETSAQVEPKLGASGRVGKDHEESSANVKRYIRLTYLIHDLLALVDDGKLSINAGVHLSFLNESVQNVVYDFFFKNNTLKMDINTATLLKDKSKSGVEITASTIKDIIKSDKKKTKGNDKKINIPVKKFDGLLDHLDTDSKRISYILEALEHYKKYVTTHPRACLKTRKHCAISTRQAQKRDKRSLKKIWQVYHNELQPA